MINGTRKALSCATALNTQELGCSLQIGREVGCAERCRYSDGIVVGVPLQPVAQRECGRVLESRASRCACNGCPPCTSFSSATP